MILEMIALCILVASAGFVLGLKVGIRPGMDQMRFKPANAEKVSKAILDTGLQALVDERAVYELTRPDGSKKRFIEGIGG